MIDCKHEYIDDITASLSISVQFYQLYCTLTFFSLICMEMMYLYISPLISITINTPLEDGWKELG